MGSYILIKWDATIANFLQLLQEEDAVKEKFKKNPSQAKNEFVRIHIKKLTFILRLQGCDLETADKMAKEIFQPLFEELFKGIEEWTKKVKNVKIWIHNKRNFW